MLALGIPRKFLGLGQKVFDFLGVFGTRKSHQKVTKKSLFITTYRAFTAIGSKLATGEFYSVLDDGSDGIIFLKDFLQ